MSNDVVKTPRRKYHRLDEAKREALLEAAIAEIGAHGFAGASLARIAAEAGIGRGLLYYYFDDRDELVRAVIAHLAAEVAVPGAGVARPASARAFWPSLEAAYRRTFGALLAAPSRLAFARRVLEVTRGGDAPPPVRKLLADVRRFLEGVLQHGQALRAVRADVPLPLLADAVLGLIVAVDGWAMDSVHRGGDPDAAMDAAFSLVRSLARPDAAARSRARKTPA